MNRRLQEIKRKVMTFNQELREIDLEEHVDWLIEQAERVQELEEELVKYRNSFELQLLINNSIKNQIKRYREALEKIKLNVKICGNEEYFPKVVEEIVNEALEESE